MARYETWVALPDLHGDLQEPDVVGEALAFVQHFKPKHRIALGDVFDFRYLRSKKSDNDEHEGKWEDDLTAGQTFLMQYKPTVWLLGNHDWRVKKFMDSTRDVEAKAGAALWGDMKASAPGCQIIDYNKRTGIHRLGDLQFIHGYATGIGGVRKHALVYGRCVIGHLHVVDQASVERSDRATCYCCGTLSQLELGYNEQQIGTLRQGHGFAYGLVFPNGKTVVWQAQFIDKRLYAPSECVEVKRGE